MKSACLAIATLTLLFGQKAIGQIEGDPKEGADTSLADTERYISNLLKGSARFDSQNETVSSKIEFNGTSVTLVSERWTRHNSYYKRTSSFDLKDLDPREVRYNSESSDFVSLRATEGKRLIQYRTYGSDIYSRQARQSGIEAEASITFVVNPTIDDFGRRLANAFAHAIQVAGRVSETPDAFK